MTESTLARARRGDEQAFRQLTDPYRRELQVHCYRMLGSLQDAEDALQETLVSAWRGLERFEERASLRAWLYSIATNRCLNMQRERGRRPRAVAELPFEPPPPTRLSEVTWLQPYPDVLLEELPDSDPGPEARYEAQEAIGLAFVTALQRLPARQRAVLVLRDVLGFRAREAAEMLQTSEPTVNSALQRARSSLEDRLPPPRERVPAPDSPQERQLASSFADAFERGDLDQVVSMLTDDAVVAMPPQPHEYQGHETIAAFLRHVAFARRAGHRTRLVPVRANGQPAFGHYIDGRGTGVFVLGLEGEHISAITRFDGAALLDRFGLPPALSQPEAGPWG